LLASIRVSIDGIRHEGLLVRGRHGGAGRAIIIAITVTRAIVRIVTVTVLLAAVPTGAQAPVTLAELVGQYAEWVAGTRASVDINAVDLDVARRELGRLDPTQIPVDPAATPAQAREMRRRLLTSFALELAAVGSRRHASSAARLAEWGCGYVRSHTPINDFDRAWQLAALSVLEGGIDSHALGDHVAHAQAVFRDEPRLLLARGVAEEQFNAPSEALVRTETAAGLLRAKDALVRAEGESFRASERAIARYREAAGDESVAAEALLRAGHVQLRLSRFDAALATWKDVDGRTTDPALLFLLHLFRGLAYEGRARIDDARASYKSALAISPRAHSATLRLAALAFRYGHGDEDVTAAGSLLQDDDPRRDPWWSYYAADWRFWYMRIERVRALLRTP
jgi:tetratricopeptide (TPR) repeat protein